MPKSNLIPLLSVSGLTLISVGSLILFKSKTDPNVFSPAPTPSPRRSLPGEGGTQVPKSIEHFLLASQQFFTQALEAQNSQKSPETVTNLLNRSLTLATAAIQTFPADYRGYLQRGNIYRSLASPKSPDGGGSATLPAAISDFEAAYHLNPTSADLTRDLANLYAQSGNAASTLNYLTQTVALEPTKAQNFYDLAHLQQQVGQIDAALTTYSQLLTILIDPTQKSKVELEKSALEKLLSQNHAPITPLSLPTASPSPVLDGHPLQASSLSGLVIAAPASSPDISVSGQTDSNSLSGTATLLSGQTSLSFTNSQLTPSSQVYVSTVSGGKNLTLEVLSKSKNTFVVGLPSPSPENIVFKWWIVN